MNPGVSGSLAVLSMAVSTLNSGTVLATRTPAAAACVRRRGLLSDQQFREELEARRARLADAGDIVPAAALMPTRADFGPHDNLRGLDWPACQA